MAGLAPPTVEVEDPGAHELDSDEEHFSDASEGHHPHPPHPRRGKTASPIPTTRVERVDDQPAHGEVPGTDAHKIRTQDAVPDELEVVPEGTRSRSSSRLSAEDRSSRPSTPGGSPIPKLVVEKIDPEVPSYGDEPGTAAHEMRLADAEPDVVLKAPEVSRQELKGNGAADDSYAYDENDDVDDGEDNGAPEDDDGGFGDDFDEFEEGGVDDDFGDFDDGFQEGASEAVEVVPEPPPPVPVPLSLPPLDFTTLTTPAAVQSAAQPYLDLLFPDLRHIAETAQPPSDPPLFLSDRTLSLWAQLTAPPPLQPPNWLRSRIRRLFLVSLGVPVDLDEILPKSEQKKLVLPNTLPADLPSRPSSENQNRVNGRPAAGKADGNAGAEGGVTRSGPLPAPAFDTISVRRLCATTAAALSNTSDAELKQHVAQLEALIKTAASVLEYWLVKADGARKEKEMLEGVIENLIVHARRARG
ncbi:hypothetical protein LTR16_001219 [Cryomyces antarcticus]|uniref:Uncharacterized protein n=1 Tax=Cryomyces antarcticus TaxID=329879 RepID=A0ABR0M8B0_9PEZI|nr:hypothetical protein LTR16_001219 [Cryomyces antarcticus]